MIKSFILAAMLIASTAIAGEKVVLEKKNTLVLRTVVTAGSVVNLEQQAYKLSSKLAKNEKIRLFLYTPGGDVVAGTELNAFLKSLPQEVTPVTLFAASMGFITSQNLGERYIVANGTLMSHRARGGVEGQIPGELNVRANYWTKRLANEDAKIAARVGMKTEDYQKLIHDEYWIDGQDAVDAKMADKIADVSCAPDLNGSTKETFATIFGNIEVTWSDCPLITSPLEISFAGLSNTIEEQTEVNKMKAAIFSSFMNQRSFLQNASMRDTYFKYVL